MNKLDATQGDAELTRFTKLLEGDPAKNKEPYRMSGQDLVAGGTLERAARISRLVRDPAGYSPAARSGVRSSDSASSISFVKMRSLRL